VGMRDLLLLPMGLKFVVCCRYVRIWLTKQTRMRLELYLNSVLASRPYVFTLRMKPRDSALHYTFNDK
jgi:hypothetical protein